MKWRAGTFVVAGVAILAVLAGALLYLSSVEIGRGGASSVAGQVPAPTPSPTLAQDDANSASADRAPTEPPAMPNSPPLVAAPPRADQPPHLRPEPPAGSPEWELLDWSLEPIPQKPGLKLRAASYLANGRYPFIRVEEQLRVEPDGRVVILNTREMVGDQVIVKLPEGASPAEIGEIAVKLGGVAAAEPFAPETWVIGLKRTLEAVPEALGVAAGLDTSIEYAEPNFLVRPARTPNDPRFTDFSQWHLYNNLQIDRDIKAPKAWDRRTSAAFGDGNEVVVAVIDSGVRYTHQDLIDNMWINPGEIAGDNIDNDGNGLRDDVYGADFLSEDGDPMDPNNSSHGTHCAGLIGAVGDNAQGITGVAWTGVQIMALRFIQGTGTIVDVIQSIDYAIAKGAKVINASYGFQDNLGGSFSESSAIQRAANAGITFVAAAGNNSANNDSAPFYPASYNRANIVSVGASDRNDGRASFSNFGATSVDLFAPGVEMFSTTTSGTSNTSYSSSQGTSFAAPVVAGAVALLVAEYPNDSLSQRVARIISSGAVDPVPGLAGLCVTGGRLNLAKLLPAADATTLPQALVWHRPNHNEPLIGSLMRTPATISISNNVTVYSGTRKFNNTNGVNTSGLVNQTGGWIFFRSSPSSTWSSNALSWHANSGDYQFWKATITNVPGGTTEYFLRLDFDSGARTTYSFHAANADGFATGTDPSAAQSSPYTFDVPKVAASLTIGATSQVYDGTARPVTVTTAPPGLAVDVTYNGSASAPTNAGTYNVVATVNDANYAGTASATLTVARASAGIVLSNLNQTHNGAPRAVTATTTPPGLPVVITYDGSASPPIAVGSYAVVATINDTNYSGSASGTLIIESALPSYAQWISQFSSLSDATPAGDPDGDSFSNAMEYFMGTDPSVFGPADAVWLEYDAASEVASLFYRKSKETFGAEGTVRWSTTPDVLASWSTNSVSDELLQDQPTWELRRAVVPWSWSQNSGNLFLRLDITLP